VISRLRRWLSKTKSQLAWFVIGLGAGWLASPDVFEWMVAQFSQIPHPILAALLLASLFLLAVLGIWILLLRNDLGRHKKHLREQAPGFDIDDQEEFAKGWDDAIKRRENS